MDKRLVELSAKLDELIEFFDPSIFGKIPSLMGIGRGLAGAARVGYGAAAPVVQRGAGALASAGRIAYGATAGAVGSAAESARKGYGSAVEAVQSKLAARSKAAATSGGIKDYFGRSSFNTPVGGSPPPVPAHLATAARPPAITAPVTATTPPGGIRSYFERSTAPGGINAPIGGTPPPVPAHLATSSVPAAAPAVAAAAPGTQAQTAQAVAQQAGQQAGQAQAAAAAAPPAAKTATVKKAAAKKPAGKKTEPAEEGGWWSNLSQRRKFGIGAGAGVLAGGAGLSYINSGNQNMGAWLDDLIELGNKPRATTSQRRSTGVKIFESAEDPIEFADPRPRNPLGEFTQQGNGGPDPNAMATVYKQPGLLSTVVKGGALALGGGALGQVGGHMAQQLLDQAKKKTKSAAKAIRK